MTEPRADYVTTPHPPLPEAQWKQLIDLLERVLLKGYGELRLVIRNGYVANMQEVIDHRTSKPAKDEIKTE